ncbi:MAG: TonB-dependent receptor plug domain-containing protein, partial [Ginsengibacter sp.]
MINKYFIKQLLPALTLCLIISGAFGEGSPRSHSSIHYFDGITGNSLSSNNRLHQPADVVIRGTVSGDNGTLAGATIREKGTNNITSTKEDGSFSLRVSKPDAVLTISFVGYQSMEISLEGKTVLNIVLKATSQELSDVVVTALGITREKKSLGYSIGEVAGKDINRVAQENVLNSLAGKVSGVTINQTGGAGSSVSMIIRGANSLSNDNQPLFVIDGVPIANTLNNVSEVGSDNRVDFGNAISSINPDDVASVTILKGPSAAALYGSRAGNGVVLITTKSGRGLNKLTVSATTSTVFDMPYKFLKWQTKYGSGQFSAIPVELTGNILTDPFGGLIQEDVGGTYGGELDRGYMAKQWNSPLDERGKQIPLPLISHPDNVKDFVQTGITTNNSVSVANSSEAINYRVSYSNMSSRGIIPNSDLFRNTLDISSSMKVNNKLRISTNIDLSRNNSNSRPAGERGSNPLQWAYSTSPHIDINDLKDYWMPGQIGLQQRSPAKGVANNPYFLAYEVKNSFVRDRLYGNIKADWQITPEFSMMFRYGLDT